MKLQDFRPRIGVLAPSGEVSQSVAPPITAGHVPVVITPHVGDVVVGDYTPDSVTIVNKTVHVVPYLLLIVPSTAVKVALVPWGEVLRQLGDGVKRTEFAKRLWRLLGL